MWKLPEAPSNEVERLKVLASCGIMDTTPDDRFDRITRLAAHIYGAQVAFIGFVDESFQYLMSVTSEDLSRYVHRRESVCNMIIRSGEPLVVGDLKTDPRLAGHPLVPQLPMRFYAGAPIIAVPDLVVGSLCVMRREAGDPDAFDLAPLLDLAAIAGDEIELWRHNCDLKRQSQVDALTGLPNRRAFDEALDAAVRRANRTGEPLSMLMLDVDHFKMLNDLSGHQAGDRVLAQLAAILAGVPQRPLDTVARYGGEEFAVILPDTDEEGAATIARTVRDRMHDAAIPHPSGGCVTVSMGGATQQGGALAAGTLFQEADGALYDAKRGGRDTSRFRVARQAPQPA